eukprot:m.181199 g.181199  ORF g.181199 m.181199 type:complete len:636 (+) comp16626_c1_seq1:284-2191(+)
MSQVQSPIEPSPFIAKIFVHSASHLLAKDLNATSDPFVRVSLNGHVIGRTDTRKSDLNPVWNQEFSVPIYQLPSPDSVEPAFKFEVLNEYKFGKVTGQIQNIGKHAFLGQVVIPLSRCYGLHAVPPRHKYLLAKRSHKSKVRGELQLTVKVIPREEEDTFTYTENIPGDLVEEVRRRSHLSVAEMAEISRALYGGSLVPGNYILRINFERIFGVPYIDKSKDVHFVFRIVAQRAKGSSIQYAFPHGTESPETMCLSGRAVSLPIKVTPVLSSPIKIFMAVVTPMSTYHNIGQATLSLGLVPVVEEEEEEAIARIIPVDLFIEKKALTMLPSFLKLRSHDSICKLRFSAWLVKELTEQDSSEEEEDAEESEEELPPEDVMATPRPSTLPEELEWELASATVTGSVHRANQLMFDENSPVLQGMCAEKNLTELSFTPWSEEGKRDFSYLMPKSTLVKANHACEHQKYLLRCRDAYVMEIETETPEVPYGKDFVTQLRIFLLQDGPNTTVKVTGSIHFNRSVMLKSTISRSAKAGMASTYEVYLKHLQMAFVPKKQRSKQRVSQEAVSEPKSRRSSGVKQAFASRTNMIIVVQIIVIALLVFLLWKSWSTNSMLSTRITSLEGIVAKHIVPQPEHLDL